MKLEVIPLAYPAFNLCQSVDKKSSTLLRNFQAWIRGAKTGGKGGWRGKKGEDEQG